MAILNSLRIYAPAFTLLLILSSHVMAADFRLYILGSYRAIVIEGNIEPGDFETFVRIVRENQAKVSGVYIFSAGGDFYEAMKIGRAMRALDLHSQVPMRDSSGRSNCDNGVLSLPIPKDPKNCMCASAGFFIHIGATSRGGTFIAAHRPYFEKEKFGKLSEADAKKAFNALQVDARNYMQEMGVANHIQEDVLGTPSDKALILDEKTIKTYFWGELPYRHEWVKNKCNILSDSERERLEKYTNRILQSRNSLNNDLSQVEDDDLHILRQKEDDERNCGVNISDSNRADAYEKYFGSKPSDFASQNFSKWSESTKYLGKQLYEVLDEEKFKEEKVVYPFGKEKVTLTFLTRLATATTPSITLRDSLSKPKVVTWINLWSTQHVSPAYVKQLVKSLENAWGTRSGGNGTTEWTWSKKEFSAKLVLNSKSTKESYMNLEIDEK